MQSGSGNLNECNQAAVQSGHTRLVFAGDAGLHIRRTHVDMVKVVRPPKHMSSVMRELSCAVLY